MSDGALRGGELKTTVRESRGFSQYRTLFSSTSLNVYVTQYRSTRGARAPASRRDSHGASSPHAHSTRFLAVAAAAQAMTKVVLSDEDESSSSPTRLKMTYFGLASNQ